jgi:hypothetical protein
VPADLRGLLIKVRLNEMWDMSMAGLDTATEWKDLNAAANMWIVLADPEEVRPLKQFIERDLMMRPRTSVLSETSWDEKTKRGKWKVKQLGIDDRRLKTLAEELQKTMQTK